MVTLSVVVVASVFDVVDSLVDYLSMLLQVVGSELRIALLECFHAAGLEHW